MASDSVDLCVPTWPGFIKSRHMDRRTDQKTCLCRNYPRTVSTLYTIRLSDAGYGQTAGIGLFFLTFPGVGPGQPEDGAQNHRAPEVRMTDVRGQERRDQNPPIIFDYNDSDFCNDADLCYTGTSAGTPVPQYPPTNGTSSCSQIAIMHKQR